MKQFTDDLSLEDFDEEVSEMLRLGKEGTGLKYKVWLDYLGKERARKNNSPRLMIDLSGHGRDFVPISIDKFNPKILIDREVEDFENVADWIKKNYSVLIRHWNQELDDFDAIYFLTEETDEYKADIKRCKAELYGDENEESIFDVYLKKNCKRLARLKKIFDDERKANGYDN